MANDKLVLLSHLREAVPVLERIELEWQPDLRTAACVFCRAPVHVGHQDGCPWRKLRDAIYELLEYPLP